jgi:hypothetical protein
MLSVRTSVWITSILTEISRGFSQYLETYDVIRPRLGYSRFLPNPFHLIIQLPTVRQHKISVPKLPISNSWDEDTAVSASDIIQCFVTCVCVTIEGVWIGEWIYWPLVHSKYSSVTNLHSLKITRAPAKLFPTFCGLTSRSLVTASNSENSSASRAQVLLS